MDKKAAWSKRTKKMAMGETSDVSLPLMGSTKKKAGLFHIVKRGLEGTTGGRKTRKTSPGGKQKQSHVKKRLVNPQPEDRLQYEKEFNGF